MRGSIGALVLAAITLAVAGCGSGHRVTGSRPPVHPNFAVTAVARVKLGHAFGFFPNGPTSGTRCLIPGPGLSRGINGTCQTRVSLAGDISAWPAVVTLTESWPAAKFRLGGSPDRTLHHSWQFKVLADGRVVPVGHHGYPAPQSAI